MALPPGPPLPASLQTLLYAARPVEFLEGCHRRYGDAFSIHTLMFGREACFCHPDVVKEVFTADADTLRAGEANAPLGPLVGPKSVLLLDGPEHLRQRRLLMPPLHGDRMTAYGRTMVEVTERVVDAWPTGRPIRAHPSMQRITLDVILRTVFGVEEGAAMAELGAALAKVLDRQGTPMGALAMVPQLQHELGGLTPYGRFRRDVARADALILEQIAARRVKRDDGRSRDDILSMLVDARDETGAPMTDAELRDELVTLLVAGHETTATALCWSLDAIAHAPRVQERLHDEIDRAPDGWARAPYLDATVREVLRLFPVVPAVGRRLSRDARVGGFDLPAGTLVVPAVYFANRHPSAYDDPETFMPERFLDKKPDPYAWIPFGGGVRRCLGMAFALYEMKAVLATALARFDVVPVRPEPARTTLRAFTHVPERGAEVIVVRRARPRVAPAAPPPAATASL
ncbi:MAG TPA: cytochrome P450 [Minicystis sp.]|nr:cytochrome P450 [Minicystis sp.]